MSKPDFSQKLSKVFLFWFALALCIPLITLVLFTLYSFVFPGFETPILYSIKSSTFLTDCIAVVLCRV